MTLGPVTEKLGSGSYFEIFAVEDAGRRLALKRPRSYPGAEAPTRRMLETEARVLSALVGEEHFPQIYGQGEETGSPYLLLERLEGLNLDQALCLAKPARLEPSLAAGIALEIAKGLRSLHSVTFPGVASLVHGDLKPHNVMVLRDGRVKVIDLSLEGGTFSYMPPERMDSKKVEVASDVFALGLILYELLTGEPLVPGEKKMEVYFKMKDLRRVPPSFPSTFPKALTRIIEKCLNAGTEGGYPDAASSCRDLSDYLAPLTSSQGASQRSEWIRRLETRQ